MPGEEAFDTSDIFAIYLTLEMKKDTCGVPSVRLF